MKQSDNHNQIWNIKYIFKILLEFKSNQTNHSDERFLYSPEEDIMKQIYRTHFFLTIIHGFLQKESKENEWEGG